MSKFQGVVADFESTKLNSGKCLIHTISCIPFTIKTGKLSEYSLHIEKSLVIKISDVLNNVYMKTYMSVNPDEQRHIDKKHQNDHEVCLRYGVPILHMRFTPAIKRMNKFILDNGGIIIIHNLKSDLQALVQTQQMIKCPRIIKDKLREFPETGMYDKSWKQIAKICSMSLVCNRCKKMQVDYVNWIRENNLVTKSGMNSLERLSKFVKQDALYKQCHAAVQDCIDLFNVIKYAYKSDGPIIDGKSYIAEPEWIKAC